MKNLKNLGKALNKAEQKNINGGFNWNECGWNQCRNQFGRCTFFCGQV